MLITLRLAYSGKCGGGGGERGAGMCAYLSNVEGASVPFAVAEDDKDAGLLDGGADASHLRGIAFHGVAVVLVHETAIGNGAMRPDAPFPSQHQENHNRAMRAKVPLRGVSYHG